MITDPAGEGAEGGSAGSITYSSISHGSPFPGALCCQASCLGMTMRHLHFPQQSTFFSPIEFPFMNYDRVRQSVYAEFPLLQCEAFPQRGFEE